MQKKYKYLPYVSIVLVAVNVIVYLICLFTGERLYSLGELDLYAVMMRGEYGRLLWATFLHVDVSHLANNMLILFFLGEMIEREIGHVPYAAAYFLSGIGGNIVSLASKYMRAEYVPSVGASGAVFGLDGLLLSMMMFSDSFRDKMDPRRVFAMVVLSLINGFVGENIDNAAHTGGLIIGFVAGSLICLFRKIRKKKI